MLQKFLESIVGNPNDKKLKSCLDTVKAINEKTKEYESVLTEEQIPHKTKEFQERIKNGETVEDLLIEAFALVKYACIKMQGMKTLVQEDELIWNMVPYDVQLIGGMILHEGNIAEMKTGEGKTLVCTMPAYLNALIGKSVYIVTVNSYLAERDAQWMGYLYNKLGLTVGVIKSMQPTNEKKAAYEANIVYGTNNEFGFDYLRDNMAQKEEDIAQKTLYYAIIDEVDSILIDEARTPLIISAPAEESTSKYMKYSRLITQLQENTHYNIDEKQKTAILNEEGVAKMEDLLNMDNIYTEAGYNEVHHIEQALKAYAIFKKDIDYVVKDGQILIVDEFTGRLMPGRRYSDGLHQAIEAKENVQIKKASKTLATITFQNYFRLFDKLSGMTGTAETEAEEFAKIYQLNTFVIPTNKPITRDDRTDLVYKNTKGKIEAIVRTVKELNKEQKPVLIGTVSIEQSELLSRYLEVAGIKHNVLNAKQHAREAEIVKNAGQKGAITIATNMAGRGTDIKLGEGIIGLGGLSILGTERHESRRIDNQLRGRAGRQGDPGMTQFYVSMEDDLMRLFGSEKIVKMMNVMGLPDDMPIENKMISNAIENAQKKVEGRNFDIRKHLVEYDDVINKQRELIYRKRKELFNQDKLKNIILLLMEREAEAIVLNQCAARPRKEWNLTEVLETVHTIKRSSTSPIPMAELEKFENIEELINYIKHYLWEEYEKTEKSIPDPQILRNIELQVSLRAFDSLWMEHIDQMSDLRDATSLAGYGQRDPLIVYKQESFELFQDLLAKIRSAIINTLFKVEVMPETEIKSNLRPINQLNTNDDAISNILSNSNIIPSQNRQNIPHQANQTNAIQTNSDGIRIKTVNTESPIQEYPKVGRNEPCPCGSEKKYKKCHGR